MSTQDGRLDALQAELREYVELVARVPEMYRHLVMDTPEDQKRHEDVTRVADKAIDCMRRRLDRLGGEDE